jgi:hypothetical protein
MGRRFSAVTGPLIWAAVTSFAIQALHFSPLRAQGVAILVLLLLMFLSYWSFSPFQITGGSGMVRSKPGNDLAAELRREEFVIGKW